MSAAAALRQSHYLSSIGVNLDSRGLEFGKMSEDEALNVGNLCDSTIISTGLQQLYLSAIADKDEEIDGFVLRCKNKEILAICVVSYLDDLQVQSTFRSQSISLGSYIVVPEISLLCSKSQIKMGLGGLLLLLVLHELLHDKARCRGAAFLKPAINGRQELIKFYKKYQFHHVSSKASSESDRYNILFCSDISIPLLNPPSTHLLKLINSGNDTPCTSSVMETCAREVAKRRH